MSWYWFKYVRFLYVKQNYACFSKCLAAPKDLVAACASAPHTKLEVPRIKLTWCSFVQILYISSEPNIHNILNKDAKLHIIMLSPLRARCTPVLAHGHKMLPWHVSVCIKGRMSKCELIELKDLSVNDPIELAAPAARTAPTPLNPGQPCSFHVVRLVGDSVSIEAPGCQRGEAGVGHDFRPYSHTHLTWCDLCGEFIWGLYKQSLRCASEYLLLMNLF